MRCGSLCLVRERLNGLTPAAYLQQYRARDAARKRTQYAQRLADGICVRCGKRKATHKTRCKPCTQAMRVYQRRGSLVLSSTS